MASEKFVRYTEYKEDNESIFETYFTNDYREDVNGNIFSFSAKSFGKCGEKEVVRERLLKALEAMREQIEKTIQEVRES